MKLYHVTDAANYDRIRAEGLLPRSVTGKPTNDDERPTHPDSVYLSLVAQVYYAYDCPKAMIVEVDGDELHEESLHADEDWLISHVTTKDKSKVPDLLGQIYANDDYQSLWLDSLEAVGSVSYRASIPPSLITRISIIDPYDKQWRFMPQGALCIPARWNLQKEEYAQWTDRIMSAPVFERSAAAASWPSDSSERSVARLPLSEGTSNE